MKLHERHDQVARAGIDIQEAVLKAVRKYELTFAELVGILANCIAGWAKSEVREERQGR
jgi:hypothetical protein